MNIKAKRMDLKVDWTILKSIKPKVDAMLILFWFAFNIHIFEIHIRLISNLILPGQVLFGSEFQRNFKIPLYLIWRVEEGKKHNRKKWNFIWIIFGCQNYIKGWRIHEKKCLTLFDYNQQNWFLSIWDVSVMDRIFFITNILRKTDTNAQLNILLI